MSLDTLVQVAIVANSKGVARKEFGVPLIAHYHTVWPERVRTYTSVQAMIDDGFLAGDAAVRAAQAIMSQVPTVDKFKVGRMATTPVAHVEELIPTPVASTKYSVTLGDTDGVLTTYEYTATAAPTVAEICGAFVTAINAGTQDVTAGGGTTELTLTGDNAGEVFYCYATEAAADGANWKRTCTNTDPGIATDLAAINGADSGWFGLVVTNPARACQSAAATWAETNRKLLGITTGDTDLRDAVTPNIGDDIKTANQAFSFAFYSDRPQEFLAGGLAGRQFPLPAGSSTYALKTVRNVSSVPLSATHQTNIEGVNANWYAEVRGVSITFPGKTGAGEYIDITHGIEALKDLIQVEIFQAQISNEKVGFTDRGIGLYEAKIRGALQYFARPEISFLDPDSIVVTVPKASELLTSDKANRVLKGVTFSATLQGAVHKLNLVGTLSV